MDILHARADSPGPTGPANALRQKNLRTGGWSVNLAKDIPSLEASLSLERRIPHRPAQGVVGEPTAVPFCDFLMAVDPMGTLQGVCRLLPRHPAELRHSLPGSPGPAMGLAFPPEFAPLLTALRYSSQSVLEVGGLSVAPGADPQRTCSALWDGIQAHMALSADGADRSAPFGFVLGSECMRVPDVPDPREVVHRLLETHGLHPDLHSLAGLASPPDWILTRPARHLPVETVGEEPGQLPIALREALVRGCRLMGPPRFLAGPECLEFHWVASRDMLVSPAGAGSRGS